MNFLNICFSNFLSSFRNRIRLQRRQKILTHKNKFPKYKTTKNYYCFCLEFQYKLTICLQQTNRCQIFRGTYYMVRCQSGRMELTANESSLTGPGVQIPPSPNLNGTVAQVVRARLS